ncbi:hypothetical protein ACTXT7_010625 [Hymenolepis weldensis]
MSSFDTHAEIAGMPHYGYSLYLVACHIFVRIGLHNTDVYVSIAALGLSNQSRPEVKGGYRFSSTMYSIE